MLYRQAGRSSRGSSSAAGSSWRQSCDSTRPGRHGRSHPDGGGRGLSASCPEFSPAAGRSRPRSAARPADLRQARTRHGPAAHQRWPSHIRRPAERSGGGPRPCSLRLPPSHHKPGTVPGTEQRRNKCTIMSVQCSTDGWWLLAIEPFDQVDVVVAARVARRPAALSVSEPGVETGTWPAAAAGWPVVLTAIGHSVQDGGHISPVPSY